MGIGRLEFGIRLAGMQVLTCLENTCSKSKIPQICSKISNRCQLLLRNLKALGLVIFCHLPKAPSMPFLLAALR